MITREVEINHSEGENLEREELSGKVVLRRLTHGEMSDAQQEGTEIMFVGDKSIVNPNPWKIIDLKLAKSVVSSDLTRTTYVEDRSTKQPTPVTVPYGLDYAGIRNLPEGIANLLNNAFNELNTLTEKKSIQSGE